MKKAIFFIIVLMATIQISLFSQEENERYQAKGDTVTVDSLEYRLIIIDPGFEAWIVSQPSKNFYSKHYYEQRNRLYVSEWNQRYMNSRDQGRYESYIEYSPHIDYGLDLNYTLYYYFKYFEKTNNLRLLNTVR